MTKKPPPRRRTDFTHITVCDAVRTSLASDYALLGTWKAVGAKRGVPAGTCQRVATSDYEPRSADTRKRLGLPPRVEVTACSCGEVHLRKGRCPNASKPVLPAWATAAADWLAAHEQVQTTAKQRVYGRGGRRVAL